MLTRALSGSGGSGASGKLYTFSWDSGGYICVISESSSADIIASAEYNASGAIYEDDYVEIKMNGLNQLYVKTKKACTFTTYNTTTRVDTAKSAGDVVINNQFLGYGCAYLKYSN